MNMSNITFGVSRLGRPTFVFQIKYLFMIKYSDKTVKGFDWNNICQASQTVAQHYISIGPMYRVIWCFLAPDVKNTQSLTYEE